MDNIMPIPPINQLLDLYHDEIKILHNQMCELNNLIIDIYFKIG